MACLTTYFIIVGDVLACCSNGACHGRPLSVLYCVWCASWVLARGVFTGSIYFHNKPVDYVKTTTKTTPNLYALDIGWVSTPGGMRYGSSLSRCCLVKNINNTVHNSHNLHTTYTQLTHTPPYCLKNT